MATTIGRWRIMSVETDRKPHAPPTVLFDGVCNLCDRSVQFIIRNDRGCEFLFSPLQSDFGARLTERLALDPRRFDAAHLNTFIVVIDGKAYLESDAWVEILSRLDAPARWLAVVRFVPRRMRDAVYRFVGRHRYQWFGRRSVCMVPTADVARRFRLQFEEEDVA